MRRNKPGIDVAPGDYLDQVSEAYAEEERWRHFEHKCFEGCSYCEAEADLERESRHVDLLNQTLAIVYASLNKGK